MTVRKVDKDSLAKTRLSRRQPGYSSGRDARSSLEDPCTVSARIGEAMDAFGLVVREKLQDAYRHGGESQLVEFLDEFLLNAVLALGRSIFQAVCDQERGFHGSTIGCAICEGKLEFRGDVAKDVKTKLGTISLKRSYYRGPCKHSAVPLDKLLGISGKHAVTPSLRDLVAWLAATQSYPEVVRVLDKLCPSKFSLKGVETITATVSAEVKRVAGLPTVNGNSFDESAPAVLPRVAVVEVDGGFASVRDHTEASREFKLALLAELDVTAKTECLAKPGEMKKQERLKKKTFVGHFSDPDYFFSEVQSEYFRRGLDHCEIFHGISDGGKWIMSRLPQLAEEGQEVSLVLDWWHADERLAEVAKTLHPLSAEAAQDWRASARAALWHSRLDEFFHLLDQAILGCKNRCAKVALKTHLAYFETRRHLLRYQDCRNRGLPIGSGAIEGGIRFVAKDRLCRTGMRWNIAGASLILQLGCVKHSNRWDEVTQRLADKRREDYGAARTRWYRAA